MKIIPAVDLKGGDCVQLVGGDAAKETIRLNNPESKVKEFAYYGAERIHIVDLDRAMGIGNNRTLIKAILQANPGVDFQVGGGVRTLTDIEELLEAGASRVITGTKGLSDPKWLKKAGEYHGDKLVLAIDANNRSVVINGWEDDTGVDVLAAVDQALSNGLSGVLYTDVTKEGRMQGPNVGVCEEIADFADGEIEFLAGGGIGEWEDIVSLRGAGVDGAIIGTPAYMGPLALKGLFD